MKHEYENDPLLQELKRATTIKAAPKIGEELLIRASESRSPSPIRKLQSPRMLISLAGGAAVLALVATLVQPHIQKTNIVVSFPTFTPAIDPNMASLLTSGASVDAVIFDSAGLPKEAYGGPIYRASSYMSDDELKNRVADYFDLTRDEISIGNQTKKSFRKNSMFVFISGNSDGAVYLSHENFALPALEGCSAENAKVWKGCLPIGSEGKEEIKSRTVEFLKNFAPELNFSTPVVWGSITNLDSSTDFEEFRVTANLKLGNQSTPVVWSMLWSSSGALLDLDAKFLHFNSFGDNGRAFILSAVSAQQAFDRINVDDFAARWNYSVSYYPDDYQAGNWVGILCKDLTVLCRPTVNRAERVLGLVSDESGQFWLVPSFAYYVGDIFVFATSALEGGSQPGLNQ